MQFDFEFDAPKRYNFFSKPPQKDSNDHSINLLDPNDYWFMITHVDVSPLKKQKTQRKQKQNQNIEEDKPLRRSHYSQNNEVLNLQIVRQQPIVKNTALIPIAPVKHQLKKNPRRKTTVAEVFVKHQNLNLEQKQGKNEKKKRMNNSRFTAPKSRETTLSPIKNKNSASVDNIRKQFSMPCPFSYRIQRQWEQKHQNKWHNLSPNSKKNAQFSMKKADKIEKEKKVQSKELTKKQMNFSRFK